MGENREKLQHIKEQFLWDKELTEWKAFGNGHINDTYLARYREGNQEKKMIIQRINTVVFQKPDELMANIESVTRYLRKKIEEAGGNPERETLNIIYTKDGKRYFEDADGDCWRAYLFIDGGICYEQVEKLEDFYESAVAFGNFQYLLADYPAETLYETIPAFHNTKARYEAFAKAVKEDVCGRAGAIPEEIQFLLERKETAEYLGSLLEKGEIPLRVTHNDTKLNNIMMDPETGKGLCVLDLDTVMPGLVMHDFGDAIRFGASTAAEDEKDLSKVSLNLELFEIYLKGFLTGCRSALTEKEISLFPMGAKVLTYEQALRFLTDYLEGDVYYKTDYKEQNLDRARTQIRLVKDMEDKWESMQSILSQISTKKY